MLEPREYNFVVKTFNTQPIRRGAGVICALLAGMGTILAADPVATTTNNTTTTSVSPLVTTNTPTAVKAATAAHQSSAQNTGKTAAGPTLGKPSGAASGKRVELGGPLSQPLKEKGFKNKALKTLNLFNPFAPVEKKEKVSHPTERSWTTQVGWNPGGSAWADEKTHHAQTQILTVTCPDVPK
jgi:hypothetical protein